MNTQRRVPVTILTGFLGSGKTTLLNRILSEEHGKRIAVIENEFGEMGIDQALVINADEEIFEMSNGCICCTVRGDLIRVLANLMKRRDKFDYVLVETTGLADPGPVAQTFFMDDEIRAEFKLDGVVTLVDAAHIEQQLGRSDESTEQIAFADVLVLNKTDLVHGETLDRLEARLRDINRMARVVRSARANLPVDTVLNLGAFDLNQVLERRPTFLEVERTWVAQHEHDDEVSSIAIERDGDVDPEKLNAWIGKLLRERGVDIFRMKGFISLAGESRRFVFQGVHMLFEGKPDRPCGDVPRRNQLVFIGRNLDEQSMQQGFETCLT
jgi:G3E family GTPase